MTTLACTRWLALGAVMALVGCGDDDRPGRRDSGPPDSGPRPDTGPVPDTGPRPDTGAVDSGGTPGMCPAGPCNPQEQTGCMAGEGCYFSGDGSECAPAGAGADGTACDATMLNVCQEGFTCVPSGSGMMGVCRHMCCNIGSTTGCPSGQNCSVQFVNSMGEPSGVGYCTLPASCDPITQMGCETGEGCYVNGDIDKGAVICISPTDDMLTEGDDCAMCGASPCASNSCEPGTECIGITMGMEMMTRCFKFCNATMMTGCTGTQTCTSLGSTGLPDLGICTPPM